MFLYTLKFTFFFERFSLWKSGCPGVNGDPSDTAFPVLRLNVCFTTPSITPSISFLFFFLFFFWFSKTGFLCDFGGCPGNSSCRPGWSQTQRDLLASASGVLVLKASATTVPCPTHFVPKEKKQRLFTPSLGLGVAVHSFILSTGMVETGRFIN